MFFILLFFGGLAYVHFAAKKQTDEQSTGTANPNAKVQPISWFAAQGFAQGDASSVRYGKRGEGNRAVATPQASVVKGSQSAGTQRVMLDLLEQLKRTHDPQWRMRFMNAYHRMSLQDDVDNGRRPKAALNVDRTAVEVNNDTGEASGFTRTQITYQQRYTRGRPRMGAGPNATRLIDQEDPGDTTALQTTLRPNGWKSVIYPAGEHDENGVKKPWPGLKVRDLEKEYWSKNGRPQNVGYTFQDMPIHKGWSWGQAIPERGKHGAYPSGRNLPGRSNRHNDEINSGGGTG
jgi:hypothetical protein